MLWGDLFGEKCGYAFGLSPCFLCNFLLTTTLSSDLLQGSVSMWHLQYSFTGILLLFIWIPSLTLAWLPLKSALEVPLFSRKTPVSCLSNIAFYHFCFLLSCEQFFLPAMDTSQIALSSSLITFYHLQLSWISLQIYILKYYDRCNGQPRSWV